MEPPWVGGKKVCLGDLGHMTKMAATPIYGKNPSKIFFSGTNRANDSVAWFVKGVKKVCSAVHRRI